MIERNNVSNRFTKLYILALSTVAVLTIVGQVLVQISLHNQSNDARVVDLAGRQRMLSQNICKNLILLVHEIDSSNKVFQKEELEASMHLWSLFHVGLASGNLDTFAIKVNNSEQILSSFENINPHFLAVFSNAEKLKKYFFRLSKVESERLLNAILKSEKLYLVGMDKVVYQYAIEAQQRVDYLKKIELILLIITLLVLFLEGIFIFKPAVAALQSTILKLMHSEQKAVQMNNELLDLNDSLRKTEAELLNTTNEKHLRQMSEQKIRSFALVKGQERERKRIARDIHDGVGQTLTALKLNIESINAEQLPEKAKDRLDEARRLVIKTIAETRTITFDLMPNVLSDFGILSGLKQLADEASKSSGSKVVFLPNTTFDRLDRAIEIGVYRIVQEGINNAIKYAQAKEITVEFSLEDNYIYLNIADNGKGFNMKKLDLDSDHIKINNGIHNMQERTNLLDGEFKITSVIGKGTKIWAKIPVKYQ